MCIRDRLMGLDIKSPKLQEQVKGYGLEDEDVNNQMAVLVSMFVQATKGNVRAAEFIRDTMGENPETLYKMEELKQRKREFEYQKQKDKEQAGESENGALKAWAEKVKTTRGGGDSG